MISQEERRSILNSLALALDKTPEELMNSYLKPTPKTTSTPTPMQTPTLTPISKPIARQSIRESAVIKQVPQKKYDRITKYEEQSKIPEDQQIDEQPIETTPSTTQMKCIKCKQMKNSSEFETKGKRVLKTCKQCKDIDMIKHLRPKNRK